VIWAIDITKEELGFGRTHRTTFERGLKTLALEIALDEGIVGSRDLFGGPCRDHTSGAD
jgi:hypothetical protein